MNQNVKANRRRLLSGQLLMISLFLIFITACSSTREFEGIVVGKKDADQILEVPNVDKDIVHNKTDEELLDVALENGGVYYSIDKEIFEKVTVGTKVVVHYDPGDGEEASDPPRRRSKRIEIVTEQ